MLQQEKPDDFVLATGETTKVREFVELAFQEVGMEIEWSGNGVDEKGYAKGSGRLIVEVSPEFFQTFRGRSSDRRSQQSQKNARLVLQNIALKNSSGYVSQ